MKPVVIAAALVAAELTMASAVIMSGPHVVGTAYADSYAVDHGTAGADGSVPGPVPAIDLTSIDDIDVLPTCELEDCSDVPAQSGLWMDVDTGDWYLERGRAIWVVIDDTATGLARGVGAWDGRAYVGGYNIRAV